MKPSKWAVLATWGNKSARYGFVESLHDSEADARQHTTDQAPVVQELKSARLGQRVGILR